MSVTNYTTADQAASALANAAGPQGVTPSTQLSTQQLPMAVLANVLTGQMGGAAISVPAAAGITAGVGAVYKSSVTREGGLIKTLVYVDLTGLGSSTTDLDIIGVGVEPAFLGRVTTAQNGTIIGGTMQCLEVPAGGVTDINLYVATEGTGAFDGAIASLTETLVVDSNGAWTLGEVLGTAPDAVVADSYLYLVNGAGSVPGTYTAGRILITLYGLA